MKNGLAVATLLAMLASDAFAGSTIVATRAALSTATPFSTSIGLSVLKRGGNAIDAAVAVAFTLAVVHPQAGNLGGGGFLLYYDAESKGVWALDFRETAPAGVPGTVAGLAAAHTRFGSMPWKDLLTPAASIAREGFRTDVELHRDLTDASAERKIETFPGTAALFFPGGKALIAGSKLVQNDLAATIERIAAAGPSEFYEGETARRLVEGLRAAGGIVSMRNLREYTPVWRAPLKIRSGPYDIYSMPPPSGGGMVLAETLNILAGYDLRKIGFQTVPAIHLQAEAERRAFIDRNRYARDPGITRIPFRELLSSAHAAAWRVSIDSRRATPTIGLMDRQSAVPEGSDTTHFTIVDEKGNIASLTTTLNENFGSGFVVPGLGFLINNGNTRMASSMTPTIIFKGSMPFLALGTRGGPTIPTSVLQVFLNVTVFGQSLSDAVAAARYHHQADPERIDFERGRAPQSLVEALHAMGHGVNGREPIGDIHAVGFFEGKIVAVADPRRGGAAGGY